MKKALFNHSLNSYRRLWLAKEHEMTLFIAYLCVLVVYLVVSFIMYAAVMDAVIYQLQHKGSVTVRFGEEVLEYEQVRPMLKDLMVLVMLLWPFVVADSLIFKKEF
ncbi:MAG: hypothetical protein NTX82_05310, partial [Candidatus Parcubacteria bacterium]|nr:hypothetical protein [Candidatus Parcubacteria bacterium]